MKLLYCLHCTDIVRLTRDTRSCQCDHSSGYYHEDGLHATITGPAIALGFDNHSFNAALGYYNYNPSSSRGINFEAFVIPNPCETVELNTHEPPNH